MILWQSPYVDVNRNHGSVCAGRTTVTNLIRAVSMIKRASAAREVATSEGSRQTWCVSLFSHTGALGGQVQPGQLTSGTAKGR